MRSTYPNRRTSRKWRHPWQVVRCFPGGGLVPCCSHRYAVHADWHRGLRSLLQGVRGPADKSYYAVRRIPAVEP